MTDCSFDNPCEQGICNLDEGICIDSNPNAFTIYINGQPFTGSMEAIQAYMMSYFSNLETVKCGSGSDFVGALPGDDAFADFEDKNLNDIRKALDGEDIIGFYNLENNKIFCEVASTLFTFWNEKKNHDRGIVVTAEDIQKLKQDRNYSRKIKGEGTVEYFVPISPIFLRVFIRQSDMEKIMNDKHYFFMIVPTNLGWIDTNPTGIGAHHNFFPNRGDYGDRLYIIIPIGDDNRQELVARDEEFVPEVIEETEEGREIKDMIIGVLSADGAFARESAMTLEDFTEGIRTHLPNVHPEKIEARYAELINKKRIKQVRVGDVMKVYTTMLDQENALEKAYEVMRDIAYTPHKPNISIYLIGDDGDILVFEKEEDERVKMMSEQENFEDRIITMDELENMFENLDVDTIDIVTVTIHFPADTAQQDQVHQARALTGVQEWVIEGYSGNPYVTSTLYRKGGLLDRDMTNVEEEVRGQGGPMGGIPRMGGGPDGDESSDDEESDDEEERDGPGMIWDPRSQIPIYIQKAITTGVYEEMSAYIKEDESFNPTSCEREEEPMEKCYPEDVEENFSIPPFESEGINWNYDACIGHAGLQVGAGIGFCGYDEVNDIYHRYEYIPDENDPSRPHPDFEIHHVMKIFTIGGEGEPYVSASARKREYEEMLVKASPVINLLMELDRDTLRDIFFQYDSGRSDYGTDEMGLWENATNARVGANREIIYNDYAKEDYITLIVNYIHDIGVIGDDAWLAARNVLQQQIQQGGPYVASA